MIELTKVTKRYGRRGAAPDAVHDVTLHIPRGAVWAVVGPNGAGKSTLLALVLGFVRPSAGDVLLEGDTPRGFLRDHGAGYLPERFRLPAQWRAGEALRMLARLERASAADAERVIALLGLGEHMDKRSGELSRGLLQRVGLAQALLARRSLIVLDEPTEGLDPLWRIRLRDIVAELRSDGATVLIASHDLGEVERVADRAVLIDGGSVRDVLETRAPADVTRYRITLAAPFTGADAAFPGAAVDGEHALVVSVAGSAELTERLGALIDLGALIAAVEPLQQPLEQRVRDALADS